VLKVVKREGDEWRSGEIVHAFGGRGVVRVLEYEDGAALLERIVPGTNLVELTRADHDDAATEAIAQVIAAIAPNAAPPWCPTVSDWAQSFTWYSDSGDAQIPAPLVRRASEIYTELCETQRGARLLHGDLQHYNVLLDRSRGWTAIDPKGVVGEIEYEIGAAMRNPVELPDLVTDRRTIERRLARFCSALDLDAWRAMRWCFSQAVLSAIWSVEDGDFGPGNVALGLARVLEPMLA